MSEYVVRPLEPGTWDGFAGLAERHNGVFGGCWCTWFHTMSAEKERTYEANRSLKRRLVEEGRAHAALVYDGDEAVAWCEYGSPAELPNIYHRKQYDEELDVLPDYRITCIFVDKRYRRRGLSAGRLRVRPHQGRGQLRHAPYGALTRPRCGLGCGSCACSGSPAKAFSYKSYTTHAFALL